VRLTDFSCGLLLNIIVYCRNCKGWPALMGVSLLWQPATVPLRMYLYCVSLLDK